MLSRRDVVKLGLVSVGTAALRCEGEPGSPELVDAGPVVEPEPLAQPVIAAFEVSAAAAIIWASSDRTQTARVEVATANGTEISDRFALSDGVGSIDLVGLQPMTSYRYRVLFPHGQTPWREFGHRPSR